MENGRATETTEESVTADKQFSTLDIELKEETRELDGHRTESSEQVEPQRRANTSMFFRIWFGLRKRELANVATGSIAAAFAGVSKPFFGFFIITVGVAYYQKDAKQLVGKYSIIFALIGLLALFMHTLQHYFYGVVGEKAMANLRKSLYSGTNLSYSNIPICRSESKSYLKHILNLCCIKLLQVYYVMKLVGLRNQRTMLVHLPQGSSTTPQLSKPLFPIGCPLLSSVFLRY